MVNNQLPKIESPSGRDSSESPAPQPRSLQKLEEDRSSQGPPDMQGESCQDDKTRRDANRRQDSWDPCKVLVPSTILPLLREAGFSAEFRFIVQMVTDSVIPESC